MQTSNEIDKLAAALSAAQGELTHASKDRENPAFRSKYATLASIFDACRTPLAKNGLAIVQTVEGDEQKVIVTTRLLHASGQWIEGVFACKPGKGDAQGMGSAATYGKRYGLSAIVGIAADDDDDGNAASNGKPSVAPVPKVTAPAAAPKASAPAAVPQANAALNLALADFARAETIDQLRGCYGRAQKAGATAAQLATVESYRVQIESKDLPFHDEAPPVPKNITE